MAEAMQGILAEAKKNKYSLIKDTLSEDDVASVWENVSSFIEKQMSQQKGVTIHGLGTFTFTQKKLDIGNNKYILMQRPIFVLSEKFSQTHALHYTKHHVSGHIPIVQLNFSAMSFESPFDRDTVESCVKEILGAAGRAVASRKNVELTFNGIGRLTIRDSKVKMRFYKEFINQMDGSGKLLDSMQNRPGTVDSVMSERPPSRPGSSATVILPKISSSNLATGGLAPVFEHDENVENIPPPAAQQVQFASDMDPTLLEDPIIGPIDPGAEAQVKLEAMEGVNVMDFATADAIQKIEYKGEDMELPSNDMLVPRVVDLPTPQELEMKTDDKKPPMPPSRAGSRMAMPLAKASGVSLLDDLVPSAQTPKSAPSPSNLLRNANSPSYLAQKPSPVPFREINDSSAYKPKPTSPKLAPLQRSQSSDAIKLEKPLSACGHPNAGQELCYLCHQRARRNVPVSFTEERKKREEEEDRLLQQFQYMKDAEDTLAEQELNLAKRHDLQKMAAFNLGVADGVNIKKKSRDTDFHPSYIFQRRPLTPPRIYKQDEYSKDLQQQVTAKETTKKKRKEDEDFLERLEQVQLAEDLAAQREQFIKDKADQQDSYKKALEAQLRFKPVPLPPRESDNEVFGKHDMNNEKMAERRRRAYELFQEQQDLVAQRKREAILKRLSEQREEEEVLDRTKKELLDDRADKYHRRFDTRKRLEDDWLKAAEVKKTRELEDRIRALSPSLLLHEQCDKYNRCAQCKRKLNNCGESNIWSESRYIPGSRLMV